MRLSPRSSILVLVTLVGLLVTAAAAQTSSYIYWQPAPDYRPYARISQPAPGVTVAPETLVTCVAEASDYDTRMDYWNYSSYQVPDNLSYSWSKSGGTFQGSTTGASVVWQAPAAPGDYTVSVSVDEAGVVPNGEGGSRDDGPAEMRSVLIRVGPVSDVTWYKDEAIQCSGITTPAPEARFHAGSTLACTAAAATDKDKRVSTRPGEGTTYPYDTCTYSWSVTSQTTPASTSPNGSIQLPAEGGRYTLSVNVNDVAQVPEGEGGSRDDDHKRLTVPINVGTEWAEYTAIQAEGITAPQDGLEVYPGEAVACAASPASDTDWRKAPEGEGPASDVIRYTWEAPGGGTFQGSTNQAAATWIAPTSEGTYQIKLRVDDVAALNPPSEYGDRDDSERTFTVNVAVKSLVDLHIDWLPDAVMPGAPWAAVRSGNIGGAAMIHLRCRNRPGVTASVQDLTLQELATTHSAPVTAFSPAAFGPDSGTPCGEADNAQWVHVRVPWDTRAGHSWEHRVDASISLVVNGGAAQNQDKNVRVTPNNLKIEAVAPANPFPLVYLGQPVALTGTVSSEQLTRCAVNLVVLDGQGQTVATIAAYEPGAPAGVVTARKEGTQVSAIWNGPGGGPSVKGVYAFRWEAALQRTGDTLTGDTASDKSATLRIAATDGDTYLTNSSLIGSTSINENSKTVYAKYRLVDDSQHGKQASAAKALIYPPQLTSPTEAAGSTLIRAAAQPFTLQTVPTALTVGSWLPYRHVICAQDSPFNLDKHHRARWAVQRILRQEFPLAINYDFDNYPGYPQRTTPYGRMAAALQQGVLADNRTGYLARVFTNQDVDHFLSEARNASIIHTFGHGGEGYKYFVTFWKNNTWSLLSETSARGGALGPNPPPVAVHAFSRE